MMILNFKYKFVFKIFFQALTIIETLLDIKINIFLLKKRSENNKKSGRKP